MFQISRFRHIGIVVEDLELMLHFYTQILGFKLERRFEIQTEDFRKGIGIADAKARMAHLSFPSGDAGIELFQFIEPRQKPPALSAPNMHGFRHIAFIVNDMETSYSDLTAKGVMFISEPVTVKEPKEVAGFQFVYFRDPEGNIIEMNQLPKGA